MQCRSHSRRRTRLFVCDGLQHGRIRRREENEKKLIVRSGISEAETTNNKRLRSTFCIKAIQTRSIARPLCNSRASCIHREPWEERCRRYTCAPPSALLVAFYFIALFVYVC